MERQSNLFTPTFYNSLPSIEALMKQCAATSSYKQRKSIVHVNKVNVTFSDLNLPLVFRQHIDAKFWHCGHYGPERREEELCRRRCARREQ